MCVSVDAIVLAKPCITAEHLREEWRSSLPEGSVLEVHPLDTDTMDCLHMRIVAKFDKDCGVGMNAVVEAVGDMVDRVLRDNTTWFNIYVFGGGQQHMKTFSSNQ